MKAFKCDECNQLFEGDSEDKFSTDLDDRYEVRIEVRVKWSETAKKEEVVVERTVNYGSLFGSIVTSTYPHEDSRDCDLCKDCAQAIAKEAIRIMHLTGERVST